MVPAAIRHFCCQDPQTVPYQTLHGLMGTQLVMVTPALYQTGVIRLCKGWRVGSLQCLARLQPCQSCTGCHSNNCAKFGARGVVNRAAVSASPSQLSELKLKMLGGKQKRKQKKLIPKKYRQFLVPTEKNFFVRY